MGDQERGRKWPADDVEGHRWKGGVTDEQAQEDDVEGHGRRPPFTDESEGDGRRSQFSSGALSGEDDVEGHG
jgi:hypothetical protein